MINIRYHIVSITAIFLALGIGTLLGSTFLGGATVDQIDRNVRNAEARVAQTEEANRIADMQAERARLRDEGLIAASGTLLDGQLTDRPVLVVVAPGVEQGTVDDITQVLAAADADLRGSLALRDDLAFPDGVDGDLADALGLDPDDPDAAAEVTDQLVAALVAAGAPVDPESAPEGEEGEEPEPDPDPTTTEAPPTTVPGDTTPTTPPGDPTTTTTEPPDDGTTGSGDDPDALDGDQPEVVTALLAADLIAVDPGPATTPEDPILEVPGYQYVFVSQPGLAPEADDLLLSLLPPAETDPPLPAMVVSVFPEPVVEDAEVETSAVDLVRADAGRAALYDTVDDIETYLGLSSMVTILRDEGNVAVGHYGQGGEATALAPPVR